MSKPEQRCWLRGPHVAYRWAWDTAEGPGVHRGHSQAEETVPGEEVK